MAVRFDAASDRIAYTGGAPAPSDGFTLTAWAYVSVDTNDFQTVARLYNGGTAANLATSGDGLGGPNYFTAGGELNSSTGFVAGEWRKVAITCTGTDGALYAATPAGATEVDTGTVSGAAAPTAIALGGRAVSDSSEWFNGRLAHVRVWDEVLSQAEIEAEWASADPVRTADLWADWPLEVHTDLTDHSGNGRHLSAGSTSTTTEDGPPLAVDVTGTATGAGGGTGAATGVREVVGTATAAGGGSGTATGVREVVATAAGQAAGTGVAAGIREVVATASGDGGGEGSVVIASALAGGVDVQIKAIMSKVISVVQGLGLLETVNGGQAMHMPGAGLRASVWPGRITSPPGSSGLSKVSIVLPVMIRIFGPARAIQVDEIEDEMLDVIDKLADAYVGKFTLDGLVRAIDIHGRFGQPMTIEPGYLDIQEGTCRVETMTLPLIINNAWEEVA